MTSRYDESTIEPFEIDIADEEIADLRRRLESVRWGPHVSNERWEDGTDPTFLRTLVTHWRDGFDWRTAEQGMNSLPQYRVNIDGQRVHFIHVRGQRSEHCPHPLPVILTHGWPSSFLEYEKIIPLLTDPARYGGDPADAFDVVVPSLPGFAFSGPPSRPGMNVQRIAGLWDALMTNVLGYDRYAAHGSDIGAAVTTILGLDHPVHVAGIHLTSPAGATVVRWLGEGGRPLTDAERVHLAEIERWRESEGAYAALQRTKPQTLANALTDSPVGLASWLVEKLRTWSDCDGDVLSRFTMDEMIGLIAVYWFTKAIGPSMRLYFEGRREPRRLAAGERVEIPVGIALFPRDIARPPREWAERVYKVARWTEMPRGGHFPAHEEPALLCDELRAFFRSYR